VEVLVQVVILIMPEVAEVLEVVVQVDLVLLEQEHLVKAIMVVMVELIK
jgi:hypothetical protein